MTVLCVRVCVFGCSVCLYMINASAAKSMESVKSVLSQRCKFSPSHMGRLGEKIDTLFTQKHTHTHTHTHSLHTQTHLTHTGEQTTCTHIGRRSNAQSWAFGVCGSAVLFTSSAQLLVKKRPSLGPATNHINAEKVRWCLYLICSF